MRLRARPDLTPINGDELRWARRNARLTQAQLAAEFGVSTLTIIRWERGYSPIHKSKYAVPIGRFIRKVHRDVHRAIPKRHHVRDEDPSNEGA